MTMRPYTDNEWDNLPHLVLTSDTDRDPSVLDNTIDDEPNSLIISFCLALSLVGTSTFTLTFWLPLP